VLDAFAHARGTYHGSGVEHSMVNQLLTEMDGFRKNETVLVVGTTNFLESLDPALLRPGRFELVIEIPAPDADDRRAIIEVHDKRLGLALSDDLVRHLLRRTEGLADREHQLPFTGDHLSAVCRALKRHVYRTGKAEITEADLDRALERRARRPVVLSNAEERVIAVHEAGHALLAMLLPKATPPERISIAADLEGALGYVIRAARARPYAVTEQEMRAEICVGLGGHTAERLVLGEVSIGARSDLAQCTRLACSMVDEYGMSALGTRVQLPDRVASEAHRAAMDAEVARILEGERERAEALLTEHLALHAALVERLLAVKVLDRPAIEVVLARRDPAKSGDTPKPPANAGP
jgi:cell division protease FtsH